MRSRFMPGQYRKTAGVGKARLYQPRRPRSSPLWKCVHDHFDAFRRDYDRKHIAHHGPLRPVVVDVIEHSWKHSGFNLFRGDPVPSENRAELENLAQYILRHSFSLDKITYEPRAARVVYHSRMNLTTHRNFEVFAATDFLAAVTQHIPDKGFQLVKYYGHYSNKARGQRAKAVGRAGPPGPPPESPPPEGWPDASGVGTGRVEATPPAAPRRRPSRTWRELIKKIWNADPLLCPKCGDQMKLIALIEAPDSIQDILSHLGLWEGRPPGPAPPPPPRLELQYEPFYDDVPFGPGDTFAS